MNLILQHPITPLGPVTFGKGSRLHRPLSNFYRLSSPLRDHHGISYPTVEHAYQAMKTLDPKTRAFIASLHGTDDAYYGLPALRAGRAAVLRPDWPKIQVQVMEDLLRRKFKQPDFAAYLKATGDRDVYETSHPIFGRDGQDHLSHILKAIRSSL